MRRTVAALAPALLSLGLLSCGVPAQPAARKEAPSVAKAGEKIDWLTAPEGPVAPLVAKERAAAAQRGHQVLVYIGATWCEPCRRFHEAVRSGALDQRFGGLRLVEFDLDRDGLHLREAGYAPKMIPMLALPAKDGFATGKQVEGSVKGDGAVASLSARLDSLLQQDAL